MEDISTIVRESGVFILKKNEIVVIADVTHRLACLQDLSKILTAGKFNFWPELFRVTIIKRSGTDSKHL